MLDKCWSELNRSGWWAELPRRSCCSCVWAIWLLRGMYTVTWCFFFNPSALPSFPPFPTASSLLPPTLCSSTPAHLACRWVLNSHPVVSATHTRDAGVKKKCVETPDRPFEEVVIDASTGCVRTDHVSLRSCMCSVRSRQSGEMVYLIFHGGH